MSREILYRFEHMSREILYRFEQKCDRCDYPGSYDFGGEYFCLACIQSLRNNAASVPLPEKPKGKKKAHSTITLKNEFGKYRVVFNGTDLPLSEVMENLVCPVLIAAGYSESNVRDFVLNEKE